MAAHPASAGPSLSDRFNSSKVLVAAVLPTATADRLVSDRSTVRLEYLRLIGRDAAQAPGWSVLLSDLFTIEEGGSADGTLTTASLQMSGGLGLLPDNVPGISFVNPPAASLMNRRVNVSGSGSATLVVTHGGFTATKTVNVVAVMPTTSTSTTVPAAPPSTGPVVTTIPSPEMLAAMAGSVSPTTTTPMLPRGTVVGSDQPARSAKVQKKLN